MRYLVVGMLTMASIVLGSFAAVNWALQGAIALAWMAFTFGVLGVLVLLACVWLYVRTGVGDARQEDPGTAFGPARDRAQERAWMREPPTVAGVHRVGRGASTLRPIRGERRIPPSRLPPGTAREGRPSSH